MDETAPAGYNDGTEDGITTHAAVDALLGAAFDVWDNTPRDERTAPEVARGTLVDPANRRVVLAWLVDDGLLILERVEPRQRVSGEVTPEGDHRHWWIEDVPVYRIGSTDG